MKVSLISSVCDPPHFLSDMSGIDEETVRIPIIVEDATWKRIRNYEDYIDNCFAED